MAEDPERYITPEEKDALADSLPGAPSSPGDDEKQTACNKLFRKIKSQRSGVITEETDMDDMEEAKRQMGEHLRSIQSQ